MSNPVPTTTVRVATTTPPLIDLLAAKIRQRTGGKRMTVGESIEVAVRFSLDHLDQLIEEQFPPASP